MSTISGVGMGTNFLSTVSGTVGGKGAVVGTSQGGGGAGASGTGTAGNTTTTLTNADGSTTTTVTDSTGRIISITSTQPSPDTQASAGNTSNVAGHGGTLDISA